MYIFAHWVSLNKPPLSVRCWQETEGTLELEDCGKFNERTIYKSVGRITGQYSTLGLRILGNHPALGPEGAWGIHTLPPSPLTFWSPYRHLLLAEPENKTKDKAACWDSWLAEKRMGKGRNCGSSEQTEGSRQLHTLFGIYSCLPSNWSYKGKRQTEWWAQLSGFGPLY